MERHISSLREVRRGCDSGEGREKERECRPICWGELVRACKWLWPVLVQSGEEKGKTEARSVLSDERGTRQLREHSGGRSCDGVTRNKSDIKLESDPPAPLLKQSAVTTRTLPPQPNTKNTLLLLA